MLKQLLKALFFIIISLVCHLNANAQTPQVGFSYSEKTEIITLARLGDADAFYKLGLAHLYGVHADQNDAVAQRFFYYADKKGHSEAKFYLNTLQEPVKESIKAPKISSRPAAATTQAPLTPQTVAEKNRKKAERLKSAERKSKRAKRQARAKAKRAEKKKRPAKIVNVKNDASKTAQRATKKASQPQIIVNPSISPKTPARPHAIWRYFTYFLIGIGLLLTAALILINVLRHTTVQKRLPADFNKQTYLLLNPDVRQAGIDPIEHFLKHGQFEGRQFK